MSSVFLLVLKHINFICVIVLINWIHTPFIYILRVRPNCLTAILHYHQMTTRGNQWPSVVLFL